jgi:hypothetical protein
MPESQTVSSGEHTDTQSIAAEHVGPERSVQDPPAAQFPGTVRGRAALDVRQLRHPSEPSRFALAASASILLGGLGLLVALRFAGVFKIVLLAATLAVALGSVWWLVQVHRAKLLGSAMLAASSALRCVKSRQAAGVADSAWVTLAKPHDRCDQPRSRPSWIRN